MKPWLRALGILVSLAALGFFVVYARRSLAGHDLRPLLEPGIIASTGLLTLLYASLIPITAFAWSRLLADIDRPAPLGVTLPILATTQFGKYLPGNVGHHLGRVLLSRSMGLGMGAILASMAYETLLVMLAGAHVGALTLLAEAPAALRDWPILEHRGALFLGLSIAVALGLAGAPGLARLVRRLRGLGPEQAGMRSPRLSVSISCYLLYAINFLIVGVGLFAVAATLAPEAAEPRLLVLLTGAFACSWLIGYIAPGAPAGLGIREAMLAFWLHDALGPVTSITLIVALRIATTVGDLLSFAWGSLWLGRRNPQR
ncbi:lysylphosphatidylglycerol synthase domain-containing protein [Marilutibacter aestuarii]|uniref:Flippase-like domain-containing protein n=1 Tax=Marilutibacter aestuarii TaxID=1706195 RepID=A0A507ZNT2_9GAMM|nr:lysylphosphatidylglycerol synthase domain-containing protein [Lysobacter aestuarii]TQD38949.1 hypothetical protein FKV25_15785 [Lysobacter aestuarii]